MAALMMGMSSCLNTEEENIVKSSVYMYNSVENLVDPTDVGGLTQSLTALEINFTQSTLTAEVTAFVAPGLQVKFSTGTLNLSVAKDGFVFAASSLPATGASISNFVGKYDPNMGMISYDFVVNSMYHVYSTASYAYNFTTMNVYDAPGGKLLYTSDEVAFGFIPKAGEKKCTFVLSNFKLGEFDKEMSTLSYTEGEYVMAASGDFTIDEEELKNAEGYTNFNITKYNGYVWNHGMKGHASFIVDGKYVEIDGSMYYQEK